MKKNKKSGFTLVELLTVIIILSLIVGLVVYIAINVIDKSKEKSYQVTVNNIQKVSSEYLLENSDKLFYVTDNNKPTVEYQCVTIQDLIDNGYFKNDILNSQIGKDRKVLSDDYIYLEKDVNTKNITSIKYVLSKEEVAVCNEANKTTYDIAISSDPSTWSETKDVTVSYKIKNYYNIDNYEYNYSYTNSDAITIISDNGNVKKFKITDNGTFTGYIKDKENSKTYTENIVISSVDTIKPIMTIDKESDNNKLINRDILITFKDNETGLKSGGVLEYGWSNSKDIEPTYQKAELNYQNGDKETSYTISKTGLMGTHYLWIKANISDIANNNLTHNKTYGGYEFIYQFEVKIESTDGISQVTGSGMHIVGSQVTISAAIKDYYKFNGWSGGITSNELSYTFTMPEHDITIKANSVKYKCSSGTITKSGNSYICIGGNGVGVYGYSCNCSTGAYCTNEVPSYPCRQCYCSSANPEFAGCCGPATCGGYCAAYEYYTACQTCYTCNSGWTHYSGSGSGMQCYRNATT